MKPEWAAGSRRRVPATRSTPHQHPMHTWRFLIKIRCFFHIHFTFFRCALCTHTLTHAQSGHTTRSSDRLSTRSYLFDSQKRINEKLYNIIPLINFSKQSLFSLIIYKNSIIKILYFKMSVFYIIPYNITVVIIQYYERRESYIIIGTQWPVKRKFTFILIFNNSIIFKCSILYTVYTVFTYNFIF